MALIWCVLACALAAAQAQSNYGSQANDIEYQGEGLPEQTVLDGKVGHLQKQILPGTKYQIKSNSTNLTKFRPEKTAKIITSL